MTGYPSWESGILTAWAGFFKDALKGCAMKKKRTEEINFSISHLPIEVQNFIKEHPYVFKDNPHVSAYLPLRRIALDKTIMPHIWRKLDKEKIAHIFLDRIMTDISLWMAVDSTPLSEQKLLLKKTIDAFNDLLRLSTKSPEVQFFMQMVFEDVMKKMVGMKPIKKMIVENEVINTELHLTELLIEIASTATDNNGYFLTRKHNPDSIIPT